MKSLRKNQLLGSLLAGVLCSGLAGADEYGQKAWPVIQQYCLECHQDSNVKGEVNFERLQAPEAYEEEPELLDRILWVMEEQEMPPKDAAQPGEAERAALTAWMETKLAELQNANPDDPGHVVMARLNQAEYNNVIRDLTGHDLRPARFFTSDQASENGFTNVGEVLNVEPVRIENYLSGAKWVVDHAFVSPSRGLVWFPDKTGVTNAEEARAFLLEGLVDWHAKWEGALFGEAVQAAETEDDPGAAAADASDEKLEAANLEGYLYAAWLLENREALGRPDLTADALRDHIEGAYIPVVAERWHELLTGGKDPGTQVGSFLDLWSQIPDASKIRAEQAREHCATAAELFSQITDPEHWFEARGLALKGRGAAYAIAQPDYEVSEAYEPVRGKLEQYNERGFPEWAIDLRERARYRSVLDLKKVKSDRFWVVVTDAWDGSTGEEVTFEDAVWKFGKREEPFVFPNGAALQAPGVVELEIPEGATELAFTTQLADQNRNKASIQVLAMTRPPEMLDLRFLPGRQVIEWPEARRFRNTRMHHEAAQIGGLLARAQGGMRRGRAGSWLFQEGELSAAARKAIPIRAQEPGSPYFFDAESLLRTVPEEARIEREQIVADLNTYSEPEALRADLDQRAEEILRPLLKRLWRRPLSDEAFAHYLGLYQQAMEEGAGFHESVKRPIVVAMVSPPFLFKLQASDPAEEGIHPLNDYELANRLSFFLWASGPDERLIDLAASGQLSDPDVLIEETKRMILDDRARALGTEFAGRWLGYYAFDDFTQPDMDKYPEYTETLRRAMYEESIRFFTNLFQENRPLTELADADYTYLNEELAKHYGIPGVEGEEMRRVELPPEMRDQRGGVFGMGSLLTVTSTPLRASPIYRGVWIIKKVLGTPTPEPSVAIEPLSQEEQSAEGLPIHEQLRLHRESPACATCHNRIDPPGLALQKYDAVGKWREVDSAGAPIFSRGELRDGTPIVDLPGLRGYVLSEIDLVKMQFAKKLASYALGRPLTISDRKLLEEMVDAMEANGGRPWPAVETLIRSKQFLYRKDPEISETLAVAEHSIQ